MKTLDFTSVSKNEPISAGIHELMIKSVEQKVSKAGNDMWLITFEDPETKNVVWENYTFVEKALFKIKELFDALGYDTDTASFELPEPEELVGNYVKAKIVQEEYEGNPVSRVKKVFI